MCIRDRFYNSLFTFLEQAGYQRNVNILVAGYDFRLTPDMGCLLYTSDAADERSSVDLGGRRIIKKKNKCNTVSVAIIRLATLNITTQSTLNEYIQSMFTT